MPVGIWFTEKIFGFSKSESVTAFICGMGRLNYKHVIALAHFKLLKSLLEILVLALEILHEESSQLGLEINWLKTKLQVFDDNTSPPRAPIQGVCTWT